MTSRSETTDEERRAVLWQNELLRERYPKLFQRLRRCAVCLCNSCADQSACRAEFAAWAEHEWNKSVDTQLARNGALSGLTFE